MSGDVAMTTQALVSAAAVGADTLALVRVTMLSAWIQAGATLVIGLAQFILIWAGLRQMNKASADRNRQLDNQEQALKALITGMQDVSAGLRTVIERTGSGRA